MSRRTVTRSVQPQPFVPLSRVTLPRLTAQERTLFSGLKVMLTASSAGQSIQFSKGHRPSLNLTEVRAIQVSRHDGQWVFEASPYERQTNLSNFTVGGKGVAALASRTKLSLADEQFFQKLKYIVTATENGRKVHVSGKLGAKTPRGYSGVNVTAIRSTTVSFAKGRWSFELPTMVQQSGFKALSIEAKAGL